MTRLLTILLLSSVALTAAPKIEIHRVYQKVVEATGQPYGSAGGIYFKCTNINPFIMYAVQYSPDMTAWTDLYNFGSVGTKTTSPLFHWYQLPPGNCFFRIIELW
jgi:hypothetical protein